MTLEKATLEFECRQYTLEPGKLYLIGGGSGGKSDQSSTHITLQNESLDAKHCIIEVRSHSVDIIDLHSQSGTFLQGTHIDAMQRESVKSEMTQLRLGNAECSLRLNVCQERSIDSSGFHEEPKNDTTIFPPPQANDNEVFLLPVEPAKRQSLSANDSFGAAKSFNSINNTSTRTSDSFNIPETQHFPMRSSLGGSSANTTLASNERSCFDLNAEIEDSFIPETQQALEAVPEIEIEGMPPPPSLNPSPSDDAVVEANMPSNATSNQIFRICTQDFNEDLFGEEVDMESRDLLGFMQASMVIPKIQHEPVIINEAAILPVNTAEAPAAADSILNETPKNVEAHLTDDACTPDLFDLPELADLKEANDPVPQPLANTPSVTSENAEALDLMPTQVFVAPLQAEQEPSSATEDENLELSGKENVLPAIVVDKNSDLTKTQIFPVPEADAEESELPVNTTLMLPTTQVFNQSAAKANKTQINKKSLNSTQISTEERKIKSVASFFEDVEQTPQKHPIPSEVKSSLSANVQREMEIDMQMCTPTWMKDQFKQLSQEQTVMATKQRIEFGNDSDDELDGINILGAEKISKDFDRLLSHIKDKTKNNGNEREAEGKKETLKIAEKSKKKQKEKEQPQVQQNQMKTSEGLQTDPSKDKPTNRKSTKSEQKSKILKESEKEDKRESESSSVTPARRMTRLKSRTELQKDEVKKEPTSQKSERETRHESREKLQNSIEKSAASIRADKKREHFDSAKETEAPNSETPSMTRLKSRTELQKDEVKKEEKHTAVTSQKSERETRHESREKLQNSIDKSATSTRAHKKREHFDSVKETESPKRRRKSNRTQAKETDSKAAKEAKQQTPSDEQSSQESVKSTRQTRTRSIKNESQESHTSTTSSSSTKRTRSKYVNSQESVASTSSSMSTKVSRDRTRNDSIGRAAVEEPKRPRSTNASSSSPTNPRRLQVSMTMVEPEFFEKLAKNSSGIWTIAKDPINSDVLIMDKGNRTLKFLIAMAKGIPIVTSKWLECVNSTKKVPRGTEYLFHDVDFEKRHKFTLLKSQEMARKQKLFEGIEFFTTPSILPQPSDMKEIIKCAGGTWHPEMPPSSDNQKLYLISSSKDKKMWHKFRRSNANLKIISSEGVMAAVMRQQLRALDMHLLS